MNSASLFDIGVLIPDLLLPENADARKWACIACDQYTSQPEYWQRVEERVGRAPSALRLILPESSLDGPHVETDIMDVNNTMTHYLREDRFALLPHAMVYVERTLDNGRVRRAEGKVGKIVFHKENSFDKGGCP